jgi:hypothetical protein
VLAEVDRERASGLADPARYERFARDVEESKRSLRELLEGFRDRGRAVGAYGAPAKGNTLLNFCGIGTDLVSFTVDRNPMKVGTFTPGTHLPVLPVEALLDRRPDFALLLAWNFADEVLRQQEAYRALGGKFVLPLPTPRVV